MPTREIAVFIASPGDLAPERKAFKDAIDKLNEGFADGAGVKFIALGWEDALAETGTRTQSAFNRYVDQCDYFILALHRRWGQAAPDSSFSSYTEEEYERARARWEKTKSPKIAVFFKNVDQPSMADPGDELKKVLAFRKKLEDGKQTVFRRFNSEIEFAEEVDQHLRAFAQGEKTALTRLPEDDIEALKKLAPDKTMAAAELSALAVVRAAIEAASTQNIEDALMLFSKATEGTTNLAVLSVAAEFFRQIGDPANADRLVSRQAAIARDRTIAVEHYMRLLPKGFADTVAEQILVQLASQYPPEVAEELHDIFREAFGGGRLEEVMAATMVKYFSTEEILAMARFLASPEGQAGLRKQPQMLTELMAFGQQEAQRILVQRHPELGPTEEPKTIEGTVELQSLPPPRLPGSAPPPESS